MGPCQPLLISNGSTVKKNCERLPYATVCVSLIKNTILGSRKIPKQLFIYLLIIFYLAILIKRKYRKKKKTFFVFSLLTIFYFFINDCNDKKIMKIMKISITIDI